MPASPPPSTPQSPEASSTRMRGALNPASPAAGVGQGTLDVVREGIVSGGVDENGEASVGVGNDTTLTKGSQPLSQQSPQSSTGVRQNSVDES